MRSSPQSNPRSRTRARVLLCVRSLFLCFVLGTSRSRELGALAGFIPRRGGRRRAISPRRTIHRRSSRTTRTRRSRPIRRGRSASARGGACGRGLGRTWTWERTSQRSRASYASSFLTAAVLDFSFFVFAQGGGGGGGGGFGCAWFHGGGSVTFDGREEAVERRRTAGGRDDWRGQSRDAVARGSRRERAARVPRADGSVGHRRTEPASPPLGFPVGRVHRGCARVAHSRGWGARWPARLAVRVGRLGVGWGRTSERPLRGKNGAPRSAGHGTTQRSDARRQGSGLASNIKRAKRCDGRSEDF